MEKPVPAWTDPAYYFDLSGLALAELFEGVSRVWEALDRLKAFVDSRMRPALAGTIMPGAYVSDRVQLSEGCLVEPGAMIKGPAIVGPGAVIRQGAYIREYVVVGAGAVVGHATEVKGSILLDGAQAPHFNYVGDSILGRHCNLGAGTKLSNLKNDGSEIVVHGPDGRDVPTGRRKLGAIVGDRVATGCNAVLSPGSLIGPDSLIYANAVVRGFVPMAHVLKLRPPHDLTPRRKTPGR